jgi:hypothetical protein
MHQLGASPPWTPDRTIHADGHPLPPAMQGHSIGTGTVPNMMCPVFGRASFEAAPFKVSPMDPSPSDPSQTTAYLFRDAGLPVFVALM